MINNKLNHYLGLPIRCNNELVGMIGISNRPNGYTQEIADDLYFLMNFWNLRTLTAN